MLRNWGEASRDVASPANSLPKKHRGFQSVARSVAYTFNKYARLEGAWADTTFRRHGMLRANADASAVPPRLTASDANRVPRRMALTRCVDTTRREADGPGDVRGVAPFASTTQEKNLPQQSTTYASPDQSPYEPVRRKYLPRIRLLPGLPRMINPGPATTQRLNAIYVNQVRTRGVFNVYGWDRPVRPSRGHCTGTWLPRVVWPPVPQAPVYGWRAREAAWAIMRWAKAHRSPLTPQTFGRLKKVTRCDTPFSFELLAKIRREIEEKERRYQAKRKPMRIALTGGRLGLVWNQRGSG